jgi:predicted phage baseplate assembly protein
VTGCECDPLAPVPPVVTNPPGQPALHWRVSPHGSALARMRAVLATDPQQAVQALARHGTDDPAVAVLDAWAVVADIVSFYTERIAEEGFLRTATELRSVRELARTLGYELRPGVAAGVDLAFTVEDAPGGPAEVLVPAGTPTQTIPGQGQLPQTFESSEDLLARPAWNAVPGAAAEKQVLDAGAPEVWLRGTGLGVRDGDPLVLVGPGRLGTASSADEPASQDAADQWDLRTVDAVTENPDGLTGWTRLDTHSQRLSPGLPAPVPAGDALVLTLATRADLFGWNAPDPAFLPAAEVRHGDGADVPAAVEPGPAGSEQTHAVQLDGDHPRIADGSWIVVLTPGTARLCRVEAVTPSGSVLHGLVGRTSVVAVDLPMAPGTLDPRTTLVLCESRALPASLAPRRTAVAGSVLDLVATDPLLPGGRRVLVTGYPPGAAPTGRGAVVPGALPPPVCEPATVLTCDADGGGTMTVTLDHALRAGIDPQTLRVLANTVQATHGETVNQVLGSGDGRVPFAEFHPGRPPLTHVAAADPSGARSTMELRVDGVAWTEVASLDTATGHDRVYTVRPGEDGAVRLVIGDGTHGARASTGVENVTATYRAGIGEPGAAAAGQVSLLTRRPLGIRSVTNPAPAHDWAAPETLQDARRNAPLRIRTLDRAVSVTDHEDFAAAFAGVGAARADEVWDGHDRVVVVSLLGAAGSEVSDGLVTGLGAALAAARDPGTPLRLLRGERCWYGVRVEVRSDPAHRRPAVEKAVVDALTAQLGPGAGAFAAPVTAAGVLVRIRAVPGVVACTMPRLLRLPDSPGIAPRLPADTAGVELLAALPARFEAAAVQPAQLLVLAPGGVALGVMGP